MSYECGICERGADLEHAETCPHHPKNGPNPTNPVSRNTAERKASPLHPSPSLLCKLGSVIVHAEEGASSSGHMLDIVALRSLLADPEVKEWLRAMDAMALLPKKR